MQAVYGRDHELREIAAALSRASSQSAAVVVRASGGSGIGKSALLDAAINDAAKTWACARVQCHRIQTQVPGSAASRAIRALIENLGAEAARYTAGLDVAIEDAKQGKLTGGTLHQTLLSLIEGILVDRPVLLAIDDAQWSDSESGESFEQILQAFAARPIALLIFERHDEGRAFSFAEADETFALELLDQKAAAAIVRTHFAHASGDVAASIVAHAGGHPIDIVALAESARENNVRKPEEIERSLSSAVARQLHRLDAPVREFLQICALISEPIEYRILAQLWPEESTLHRHIEAVSGRYLVQGATGLRFVHGAIAENVKRTVTIEIPFRRRILGALLAFENQSLEGCERIVEQAAACGDREIERTWLLKLAGQAAKDSAPSAASEAYRRALDIALPQPPDFVNFFLQYASMLMTQNRMGEAKDVLARALLEAPEAGVTQGIGALANLLIIASSRADGNVSALAAAGYYLKRLTSPGDRLFLLSGAAWLHSCALDEQQFQDAKEQLAELGLPVPDMIEVRFCIAEAFLQTRLGRYTMAAPLLDRAAAHAASVPLAGRTMLAVGRACIELLQFGGRNFEERIANIIERHLKDNQPMFLDYIKATITLCRGNLRDAQEIASQSLAQRIDLPDRQRMLGIIAASAAWQNDPQTPWTASIEEQLRAVFLGDQTDMLIPLATWWAAATAQKKPSEARELLARIIPRLGDPFDMDTLLFPIAATLAAVRIGDADLLRQVLERIEASRDASPWQLAQKTFAASYAREMLEPGSARTALEEVARRFDDLSLPFYAAAARIVVDPTNREAAALLRSSGVRAFKPLKDESPAIHKKRGAAALPAHPSKRELEIIALVAKGETNRQMAETLFLSERTIEAHLSNVFNKLGVSSRTQVAAWYLSTIPVA